MSKQTVLGDDLGYVALAARQLFSVIFIIASAGHFTAGTVAMASDHGLPMAGVLVPVSGLIALAGGLSVLFGYRARTGGWLLVLFLVPVTFIMHNFWAVTDPVMFQIQLALFVRNIILLGGALLVARVGAGSLSLDAVMASRVHVKLDCAAQTS
jgi:putative oxidoreductase